MGKFVGIDYGTKRVGIAISDELGMLASPLDTVHSKDVDAYLQQLIQQQSVKAFVLGLPTDLKGQPTDSTEAVMNFSRFLKKKFPDCEVHMVDERFTSSIASQSIISAGVPKAKRRDKSLLDKVSAAIILQSFLDSRKIN